MSGNKGNEEQNKAPGVRKPILRLTAIVLTLVGLLVGMLIGYLVAHSSTSSKNVDKSKSGKFVSLPAAQTKANLVALGVENTAIINRAVDASLNNTADAPAFKNALSQSSNDVAESLSTFGGNISQDSIRPAWEAQAKGLLDYADAAKKNDQNAKNKAKSDINGKFTLALSKYFAGQDKSLSESNLKTAFGDYISLNLKTIDLHASKNYDEETAAFLETTRSSESLFNILANSLYNNKK